MNFCVLGGMNLDIIGTCGGKTLLHDSNIGSVSFAAGGVGHNIARALAGQGHAVELMTAVSTRPEGSMLLTDCAQTGISLAHALRADAPVSTYMCVHGGNGDMLVAVNDMQSSALITPEYVETVLDALNSCSVCVLDANLSGETLAYAAEHIQAPLAADAVSAAKCARLKSALSHLALIKLNLLEAQTLTGCTACEDAARSLLDSGCGRVLISLGADGACAADASGIYFKKPSRVYACQTNGAGDAMTAGAVCALAQGLDARKCLESGMEASEKLLKARSAPIN